MSGRTVAYVALAAALCLVATSCGDGGPGAAAEPDPPVGTPVLPDLTPKPQYNVLTKKVNGRWHIFFSTYIVNAGVGDFILRATRLVGSTWHTEQDIQYSKSGARRVSVGAPLIWGGDGHNHWHIAHVASVWLVPLNANGRPVKQPGTSRPQDRILLLRPLPRAPPRPGRGGLLGPQLR